MNIIDWTIAEDIQTKPTGQGIQAKIKRRCGILDRLVLESIDELITRNSIQGQDIELILFSQFGEIQNLQKLFASLQEGECMSPTQFSNSVHHTSTGYMSLNYNNRFRSNTFGGTIDSIVEGLLEVYYSDHTGPIVLTFADEPYPDGLLGLAGQPGYCYSLLLDRESRIAKYQIHWDSSLLGSLDLHLFDELNKQNSEIQLTSPYGGFLCQRN